MKSSLSLVFSILFLSSCSIGEFLSGPGLPGPDRKSPAESAELYYKLLKWKYFDRAAVIVDVEKRNQYEDFVSRNEDNLNITAYEVKEVIFSENGTESVVKINVKYYKYPSVSEETVILEDKWVLKDKNWYIYSDFEKEIFK